MMSTIWSGLNLSLRGLTGGATSCLVAGAISSTKSSAYYVPLNNSVTEFACCNN